MRPLNVEISAFEHSPGLLRLGFHADYGKYTRRGTIRYDTENKQFLSHIGDIKLLAAAFRSVVNMAEVS